MVDGRSSRRKADEFSLVGPDGLLSGIVAQVLETLLDNTAIRTDGDGEVTARLIAAEL